MNNIVQRITLLILSNSIQISGFEKIRYDVDSVLKYKH